MKGFSNALKQLTPVKKPIQTANRGANGYDNPRENIDPHIKTRDISTKNISAAILVEANDLRANRSLIVSGSNLVVRDGKVGIGRNPDYQVDVYGLGSIIRFTKATVGGLLFNAGGADIQGRTAADANGDLILNRYGGNVGVGTASPTSALHISGGRVVLTNYNSNVTHTTFAGQMFVSGGALMYVGTGGTLTVLGAA